MSQDPRLGGAFVGARGPCEANEALQSFEGKLDAPAQTVEALSKLFEPNGTVLSYTNWIFVMPLFCA